ncbi:helix-turn-helix domain-containing protein [Streptomyces sp. NPDC005209]|uniref:helix-turn-helix transcriptional regulator n=1 Tax=Streptomyces sp. NPDC005209 TaxID=3156715 RepID=UPI0033A666D0
METEWLTPPEVAAQLGVHPGTLANWRCMGLGPKFTKLSRHANSPVRYAQADVDAYQQQMRQRTAA